MVSIKCCHRYFDPGYPNAHHQVPGLHIPPSPANIVSRLSERPRPARLWSWPPRCSLTLTRMFLICICPPTSCTTIRIPPISHAGLNTSIYYYHSRADDQCRSVDVSLSSGTAGARITKTSQRPYSPHRWVIINICVTKKTRSSS